MSKQTTPRKKKPAVKLWIMIHTHRHGLDVWPVLSEEEPNLDEIVASDRERFEVEREDENLEVRGPHLLSEIEKYG